jgi:hypothetical protein
MTYIPKRGDDDIWARAMEGDVQAVEAATMQTLHRRKTKKSLIAQINDQGEGEQWFDEKFSHRRRRRGSVHHVVAEQLRDTEAPLHQADVEELVALKRAGFAKMNIVAKSTRSLLQSTAAAVASPASPKKKKVKLKSLVKRLKPQSVLSLVKEYGDDAQKTRVVGTLFDHIFVRPKAPRETVIKYEKHHLLLPLLRSMGKAHARGETNVATHMRNATILTKAYPKLREIDPNDLLESYVDRKKIVGVAEAYIEEADVMKQYAMRVVNNKRTSDNITQALMDLELCTHSLAGPERYQCFHSKFRQPRVSALQARRRRKRRKKKRQIAGIKLKISQSSNGPGSPKGSERGLEEEEEEEEYGWLNDKTADSSGDRKLNRSSSKALSKSYRYAYAEGMLRSGEK